MSRRLRLLSSSRDEGGFALMMTIVLMLMLAVLAVALLDQALGESNHSQAAQTVDGAYQAAEAGLNAYTAKLLEDSYYSTHFLAAGEATRNVSNVPYLSSPDKDTSIIGTPAASASSWTYASKNAWTCGQSSDCPGGTVYLPGSGYQYDIEVCPPIVNGGVSCGGIFGTGSNPYTRIIATGRPLKNNDKRTWRAIELDAKPFSLSDFQMFSKASVSYGSTATTYGPVYSQGDVTFDGSAFANVMAEGNVKTSGGSSNIRITAPARAYDVNSSPDIRHAPGLSVEPSFSNFQNAGTAGKAAAQTTGIYLNDTSANAAWKLKFDSNGTVEVYDCHKGLKTAPSTYYDISQVTSVNGNPTTTPSPVCTQYTVPGKPWPVPVPAFGAIYAEQSVLIEGVVSGRVTVFTYVDAVISNNITYNGPNDVLGIIANNNVVIAEYVPDHLIWHAAVIAQTGSFHSYDTTATHSQADFYGSTTTYGGGSMGEFSARNYYFDSILKYIAPPFFPTLSNELSVVLQREVSP